MNERSIEGVGLYCDIMHDIIVWAVEQVVIDLYCSLGYACHSMSCSKYIEDGCPYYGIAPECKALMRQAQKIAKDNLICR